MEVRIVDEPYEYSAPFYSAHSTMYEVLVDGTPFYLVKPLGQPDGLVLIDEDGYVLGVFKTFEEAEKEIPEVISKL